MDRLELETALRDALEFGQFRLRYQPIHSLADGRVAEVEALLRWDRPGHGLLMPASFIAVAEESGLIVPIGQWVLQEASRQALAWNQDRAAKAPLVVSVNLSARQFDDANLVRSIGQILEQTGLQPAALKLEITESAAIRHVDSTVLKMQELKALGVQIAIDDFGTGYSSLNYVKRFPVDALKIDRSFIEGLGENLLDTAIVQSVVALAKNLQLSVVGEGVESNAQAVHLRDIGCQRAQGFLFAHPESPETITALLKEGTPPQVQAA